MLELVRDSPFGQLVRYATKNRVLKYPEEEPDFECPICYTGEKSTGTQSISEDASRQDGGQDVEKATNKARDEGESRGAESERSEPIEEVEEPLRDIEKATTEIHPPPGDLHRLQSAGSALTRTRTQPYTEERLRQEEAMELERRESRPITATKTADGTILVDWYTTDDQDNPQVCHSSVSVSNLSTDAA